MSHIRHHSRQAQRHDSQRNHLRHARPFVLYLTSSIPPSQALEASEFGHAFQSLKRSIKCINALLGFLAPLAFLPRLRALIEVLLQIITQRFKSALGLSLQRAPPGFPWLTWNRLGRACEAGTISLLAGRVTAEWRCCTNGHGWAEPLLFGV